MVRIYGMINQKKAEVLKVEETSKWVAKLKHGDEMAFQKLYLEFSGKIYHVCRRMNLEHEDAEGMVQDVFMKIWRSRENLDPTLSFNAYLLAITRSKVIKLVRRKARKMAYEQYALSSADIDSNPTEDYIIFSDLEGLSNRALEELPYRQKQIFMLKNVQDYSIEEIATYMNLSTRTVENQIYRATKSLRAKLLSLEVNASLITLFFAIF